jgi:hypothetical protein
MQLTTQQHASALAQPARREARLMQETSAAIGLVAKSTHDRLDRHLRPTDRCLSRTQESAGQERPYQEDEAQRDQHCPRPSCGRIPVVRACGGRRVRSRRWYRGGSHVCIGRCGQKHLHVDRAWRGVVWRERIDCGLGSDDGCRGHGYRQAYRRLACGHRSCIGHLGRGCHWLRRARRRRTQHLSPRIENRLFTQFGIILFTIDGRPPHHMMTDLLLRRNSRLVGLEPALPVTIDTIDPVLAGHRRSAWLRHTRRSDWSRRVFGASRRGSLFRGGV